MSREESLNEAKLQTLIKVENLDKVFDLGKSKLKSLGGINIDFHKCEFTVIYGPSGAGKTTLLSCLSGLEKATSGRIAYENINITSLGRRERASFRRKKIGFIFQNYNLIDKMTAEQNVEVPLILNRVSKLKRKHRVAECLHSLGLKDLAKRKVCDLSGGERQRVAIARALVNDPQVILADEPTGNLDQLRGYSVIELLKSIAHEQNRSVILVTHNPNYIGFADKVVYLEDGGIKKVENNGHPLCSAKTELSSFKNQPRKWYSGFSGFWFIGLWLLLHAKKRSMSAASLLGLGLTTILLVAILTVNLIKINQSQLSSLKIFYRVTYRANYNQKIDNNAVKLLSDNQAIKKAIPIKIDSASVALDSVNSSANVFAMGKNDLLDRGVEIVSGNIYEDQAKQTVVTEDLVRYLGEDDFSILKKTLSISLSSGKSELAQVVGVSKSIDSPRIYLPVEYLAKNAYSYIDVELNPGFSFDQLSQEVESQNMIAYEPGDTSSNISNNIFITEIIFIIIGILTVILALVSAYNFIILAYDHNFYEYGVLKALGVIPSDIPKIFSVQALSIGILGGIFAILFSSAISYIVLLILKTMLYFIGLNVEQIALIEIRPALLPYILVAGVLVSVLTLIYPVKRVTSLSALETIRNYE